MEDKKDMRYWSFFSPHIGRKYQALKFTHILTRSLRVPILVALNVHRLKQDEAAYLKHPAETWKHVHNLVSVIRI